MTSYVTPRPQRDEVGGGQDSTAGRSGAAGRRLSGRDDDGAEPRSPEGDPRRLHAGNSPYERRRGRRRLPGEALQHEAPQRALQLLAPARAHPDRSVGPARIRAGPQARLAGVARGVLAGARRHHGRRRLEADDRGDQEGPEADGPDAGGPARRHLRPGAVRQQQVGRALRVSRPGSQLLSPGRIRHPPASDGALAEEEELGRSPVVLARRPNDLWSWSWDITK